MIDLDAATLKYPKSRRLLGKLFPTLEVRPPALADGNFGEFTFKPLSLKTFTILLNETFTMLLNAEWCTVVGALPRLKHPITVALFSALLSSLSHTFCDHANGKWKRQMVLGTLWSGEAAKGRVCELPNLKVWPRRYRKTKFVYPQEISQLENGNITWWAWGPAAQNPLGRREKNRGPYVRLSSA